MQYAPTRRMLGVGNTPLRATGYGERTHVAVLLVAPREERIGWEPEKRIELGDHALAQRQGGRAVVAVGAAGWLRNNAVDDAALEQLLGRDAHRGRRLRGMNGGAPEDRRRRLGRGHGVDRMLEH